MNLLGRLGAAWGISGVLLLLMFAIYRLSDMALNAFIEEFQWQHWLLLISNIVFMAYSEGYKGFQLAYSPRVAARARHLLHHPQLLHVIFAPLFCMGYFYATRRRLITAYALLLGILLLILIFQQLSQPWRGILDAGVVVGLSWGVVSLVWFCFHAMVAKSFAHSPEIPLKSSSQS
ncbi:MAG: hypothetical protein ACI9KN_001673 [Gammaproteobacteria bacterium]|jgi:hypothetical protein